jgi:hypothetical protein
MMASIIAVHLCRPCLVTMPFTLQVHAVVVAVVASATAAKVARIADIVATGLIPTIAVISSTLLPIDVCLFEEAV